MTAQKTMLMSPARPAIRLDWRVALLPLALWAAFQTYCANEALEVQLAQDLAKHKALAKL